MRDAGLDAMVSISPENFAYVTGFLSPTQPLMRWRHAMALVDRRRARSRSVVVDMEASTIRAKSPPGTEIAVWREFKFDAMAVLADLLRKQGLAEAEIGIEMDYLPAGDFAALRELLPKAQFAPAQALLARLRADQDAGGDRDPAPAVAHRRQGDHRRLSCGARRRSSEMDLAAALTRGVYEQGAEYFKLMIVATGERSVFPECRPDRTRAQARRRLPRRDLSDDRRLSCRRLPHRRGRRGAAARPSASGQT